MRKGKKSTCDHERKTLWLIISTPRVGRNVVIHEASDFFLAGATVLVMPR